MPVPGNVCTRCGFDNATSRGACVMCLSLLSERGTGQKCASCGADNPRNALFCHNCANAFTNAVATPNPQALAGMVTDAVGGYASAGGDSASYDDGYDAGDFDSPGDYVDDYAYEESVPVADTKPPVAEVAPEAVPGPVMDSAMAELSADEDFIMTPPPGVVEEPVVADEGLDFDADEDFSLPTAPGTVSEPEAITPPPPPPPGVADEEEDFLPPPPPPGVVEEEEDFLPPPPPPGVVEEEDFLPPPPPPAAMPASAPEAPPAADAEGESDFGMWELNYENEEEEEEEK